MKNFIKKIQLLKLLRNILIGLAAVIVLAYITFDATINSKLGNPIFFQILLFAVLLITVTYVLFYEWRYGDAERYLKDAQCQVSDAGYYYTARKQETPHGYAGAVKDDLSASGYRISEKEKADGLTFDYIGMKPSEYVYAATFDGITANEVTAYRDAAVNDLVNVRSKRKGECIVLFICHHVDESAVSVSKQFVRRQCGRRKTLTVYPVMVDLSTRRVYFLGNKVCRAQKMAVNYVLNCWLPLKPEYIGEEKIAWQLELAKKLDIFDIKSFKNNAKKG